MRSSHFPFRRLALAGALLAVGLGVAQAELADRSKPIVVEADRPGILDLQRQVVVFNGNVHIVQGTMSIRAERIEVREQPDGSRSATAIGAPGRQASYQQKREGLNESVEGSADRIEYDGSTGRLRLTGDGKVRRLRAGVVADEITGAVITWDDNAELFSVQGNAPGEAASGGRVRAVLTPRAAAPAGQPASAAPTRP